MISVLSGGVGAARLLQALGDATRASDISAIINVGDDLTMHGLTICPDLDTITYTLARRNNDQLGWGLRDETWRVMDELDALGGETWFRLGDRDLATHLYRSQRLANGATKTIVTRELAARWGVDVQLLPATNDPIATEFITDEGRLSFQEYFVRYHHDVVVRTIEVVGARDARATPEVLDALRTSSRLVIAPSNPLISIDPILQIPEIFEIVASRRNDVVAVSPLIGGKALKGPADRLLGEHGFEISCVGVAEFYGDLVGTWIIDEVDAQRADEIRQRGCRVEVTTTIMSDRANAARLANVVLK
ncbi:MAG: 2-phospho-L-lactate transferase [Acidimicrobiales bacterium]